MDVYDIHSPNESKANKDLNCCDSPSTIICNIGHDDLQIHMSSRSTQIPALIHLTPICFLDFLCYAFNAASSSTFKHASKQARLVFIQ
jgi:hypothetical protein